MNKLFSITILICLFLSPDVFASSYRIEVVEDSYICSDNYADINYGNDEFTRRAVGKLNKFDGLQVGRALYKFQLPLNIISAESAILRLKVWDNWAGYPMSVSVHGTENNWDDMSVTWNNQPALFVNALDSASITQISGLNRDIIVDFDVTDFISQQMANEDFTVSFMLKSSNEDVTGGVRWFMSESQGHFYSGWFQIPGMAPELVLNATVPEPASLILLGLGGLMIRRQRLESVL